ncbi:hotdog fold domain-containing protein [Simiduia litorea]|uniref:hotdog fold domain-containing protein n=1 Tax=Simiduia litorea TaxID=1435348 RepID=UPI0036F333E5
MSYVPSKSPVLKLWRQFGGSAIGRWLVSRIVCFNAPYFSSIKPVFTVVEPGLVEVAFKKRRAVHNHIKSVHAIAMCNAAELAGGVCLDVSLNANFRWIPVGMTVQYLKIAKSDLRAVCKLDAYDWDSPQDVVMPVCVFNQDNVEVFHADITMRISPKKS